MRSRPWVGVVVLIILLSAGLALLVLSIRGTETVPIPTPSPPSASAEPSTPTSPPAPSPTPGPLLYTIQEGDTLFSIAAAHGISLEELVAANGLADPNLIRPGDVLVIPGRTAPTSDQPLAPTVPPPTTPPRPPLPTPTPSGPPVVEIASVLGAGNLATEVVLVRNRGGAASMEDWTLSDAAGNRFTFPRLVLFPGGEMTIHSGPGQSAPTHLYWGRAEPAWDSGELLVLRDEEGETVDTYIVP